MRAQLAVIKFIDSRGRPVDPGYGVDEGVDPGYGVGEGGHPDQGLPPMRPGFGPVDPGYGVGLPPVIDNGLPGGRPTFPVKPDQGLPSAPGVWPKPPVGVWPPMQPIYPSHPIYPVEPGTPSHPIAGEPGTPTHPIELPPGSVWPPLPPAIGGKILAFCWLVGIGYRWVVLDPSLKPGFPDQGLPGEGDTKPDQGLPEGGETPQPKSGRFR